VYLGLEEVAGEEEEGGGGRRRSGGGIGGGIDGGNQEVVGEPVEEGKGGGKERIRIQKRGPRWVENATLNDGNKSPILK